LRWNAEGDGHLTYRAYGDPNQTTPPSGFRTEGEGPYPSVDEDFEAFGGYEAAPIPQDPTAAIEMLLARSANGGVSPGPHATPAASVAMSAREYDVFRAVSDISGLDADAFLATPAQVSVMMTVLEGMPGATVTDAIDPAGRPARRIEFDEGDVARYVFVDPSTHILLATGGRSPDIGEFTDMVVWASGIASSLDGRITQELIPTAIPHDLGFFDELTPET
jgi:hypothetical protein